MITMDDVKQISPKISLENGISDDDLSEDVSEIAYRIDVFECGDSPIIRRCLMLAGVLGSSAIA